MKSLFLCALLLLPSVAWAADHPCQTYDPVTRTTLNTCMGVDPDAYDRLIQERAGRLVVSPPTPITPEEMLEALSCRDKMEAAMTAMEPLIIFYAQGSQVKSAEFAKEVKAIWRYWDAVKRECWKEAS